MTQINPYLSFDGQAEQAMGFYKSVFGGDLVTLMRWRDNPGACESFPDLDPNLIMHSALPIGGTMLMASDNPMGNHHAGNNFTVAIGPDSREDADRIFNGLSAGGNVTCPMQDMFWGDYFGSFTDKFGINWLINYSEKRG